MAVLQIENLTFRYRGEKAEGHAAHRVGESSDSAPARNILNYINLAVDAGEFLVISGPSGCGKTTLLRILKQELAPIGEAEGTLYQQKGLKIGFVPQNVETAIVTDKVWHELAFGLENMGMNQSQMQRSVAEIASFFGIDDWFHKSARELSGGQKQLLNLASVLVMQPDLLLLDEPTSQLDPLTAEKFLDAVKRINEELGITVILVEQRLELAVPLCDRLVLMKDGTIIFDGAPSTCATSFKGLPAAMELAVGLTPAIRPIPVTVKEGRKYFQKLQVSQALQPEQLKDTRARKLKDTGAGRESVCLSAKDLYFAYDRKEEDILSEFSLELRKNEIFGLLGGNGTGKTTALLALAGALRPYRGKVRHEGMQIAYLPQDPQLLFSKETVREELGLAGGVESKKTAQAEGADVKDLLVRFAMEGKDEMHPFDLSGGEQQRLALIKVLLKNPDVLLLDEPTKGLDGWLKEELAALLKGLKSDGKTILFVSHDVEWAASVADRCGMLFDGQVRGVSDSASFFKNNMYYTTSAVKILRGAGLSAVTTADALEELLGMLAAEETTETADGGKKPEAGV